MNILFIDPIFGISGDMMISSFLDAGMPFEELKASPSMISRVVFAYNSHRRIILTELFVSCHVRDCVWSSSVCGRQRWQKWLGFPYPVRLGHSFCHQFPNILTRCA